MPKTYIGKKAAFSTNGVGKLSIYMQSSGTRSLSPGTKMNSKYLNLLSTCVELSQ
jgi:hypothetical protein